LVANVYIATATAPISNDPETSDLDRWCHDVDNLNVVDGVPSRRAMIENLRVITARRYLS
jgi:hypothetical protein